MARSCQDAKVGNSRMKRICNVLCGLIADLSKIRANECAFNCSIIWRCNEWLHRLKIAVILGFVSCIVHEITIYLGEMVAAFVNAKRDDICISTQNHNISLGSPWNFFSLHNVVSRNALQNLINALQLTKLTLILHSKRYERMHLS